jgi:hypothetical protein
VGVGFLFNDIVNQLNKPVNLPVLVVHGSDHLSLSGEDAHIYKRRDNAAFRQDIVFHPVMGGLPGEVTGRFGGLCAEKDFLFLGHRDGVLLVF